MRHAFRRLEQQRFSLQIELDGLKTQAERNKLGQYSTPILLARDILRYAGTLLPKEEEIRFLDPALGTGVFYSALRCSDASDRLTKAVGFEIDAQYGRAASALWS